MKRLLLPLLAALALPTAVLPDHGPFNNEGNSEIHQLHLGFTTTTNPNGEAKTYGIRACSTKELNFVRPWGNGGLGNRNWKGTIPFNISTENVVAFGLSSEMNSGFRTGNAAALTGAGVVGAVAMPIALPLALVTSGGGKFYQYSILTINSKNGRVAQRNIKLYSEKDVNYLNQYLNISTGYNPGEQLTYKELEEKFTLLKEKNNIENKINCSYMQKYGTIIPEKKKKKDKASTSKSSVKVNCDSPVWKNKPRCN